MNYEKLYNEAQERFKAFKEKYYTKDTYFGDVIFDKTGEMQKDFESIFPELCESEDERIRKWIANYIHRGVFDEEEHPKALKAVEWLEKQKEQKPVERWQYVGEVDTEEQKKQESVQSEDERIRKALYELFKAYPLYGLRWDDVPDDIRIVDVLDWLEKQKERDLDIVPELRPTAWGEGYQHGCKDTEEKYSGMVVVSQEEWDTAIADAFKHGMDEGEKQKEQNGEDEECIDFTIYHPLKNGKGKYECIPYSFYGTLTSFSEDKDLISFLRTCFYTEEECNEWIKQQKEHKPNIELIRKAWYTEGYSDRGFNMEPRWIIKTGEGGPRYDENPKYGQVIEETPKVKDPFDNEQFCRGYEAGKHDAEREINTQQPAKWSEEDRDRVAQYLHDRDGGMLWSKATEITSDILDILHPQPHWKPQPESLEALMYAIEGKWEMIKPTSYLSRRLEDLYEGLVNAYNVDESFLTKLHETALTGNVDELRELKNKIVVSMDSAAPKKQDYSGLSDFERAIHRGFLCAGVENVPVNIIKETAQECLAQLKPAEWSEDYDEENLQARFAFYTYKDDPSTIYLSNVFVEETSRNKGFGTKILAAAEKVAETFGATSIRLKVKRDNPAHAWYQKHGYSYITFEDEYDWFEKTLEYMKPNKQEWSEEDEEHRQWILECLADGKRKVPEFAEQYQAAFDWLKSLRPQPHTVSIKDATKFGNLEYERGVKDGIQSEIGRHWKPSDGPVWRIWENGACGNSDGIPIAIVKEGSTYRLVSCLGAGGEKYIMLSDLEKLPGFDKGEFETAKQEPHWKPSEEQMEQLRIAAVLPEFGPMVTTRKQFPGLESLYDDLKKLM